MTKTKMLYYGLWDNKSKDSPERVKVVDEVLNTIKKYDKVSISFSYMGRTRHELASISMIKELEARGCNFESRYEGYDFIIWRDKS